jgi:hypothetical protein
MLEFQARFADEDACRRYLFESRWPDGFSCPRCGSGSVGEQPKRGYESAEPVGVRPR